MIDTIIVIAENDINAGQLDNLKALLREMMDIIQRDEPGTLNYEWFIADDGKSVHVYERYADSGACMVHLANVGPKYGERLVACVTATKIAIYGNPSDEVRKVFTAYSPIYMSPFVRFAR